MKTVVKAAAVLALAGAPAFAFATGVRNVFDLVALLNTFINTLMPFIIGLAVLVILWGLFNYIAGAGDEEKRAQAKQYIIWGIIGLFVMVSIWGLVNVLKGTFGLDNTNVPPPTFVPGATGRCPNGSAPVVNSGVMTCP